MISLRSLTKRFGRFLAVDDLDLEIKEGEFLTLLGPSGCGKTTTLRMIAGLEDPDEGEIHFGERCIYSSLKGVMTPTGSREIGMIFQSYALWPHMTVYKNVAFGLEEKKVSRSEIKGAVTQALEVVQLDGLADRYPSELSGGQQQRVALARALVVRPKIFLMDEPLSNLDAKLRIEMRSELKRLHAETGTTTIYVTHDQYEALTMSDRIAVMREGKLQQLDSAQSVYNSPSNLWVANFIGNIPMNLLRGTIEHRSDDSRLTTAQGLTLSVPAIDGRPADTVLGIRPEHVKVGREQKASSVPMVVQTVLPAGSEGVLRVSGMGTTLLVKQAEFEPFATNEEVWVDVEHNNMLFFDPTTEELLPTSIAKAP